MKLSELMWFKSLWYPKPKANDETSDKQLRWMKSKLTINLWFSTFPPPKLLVKSPLTWAPTFIKKSLEVWLSWLLHEKNSGKTVSKLESISNFTSKLFRLWHKCCWYMTYHEFLGTRPCPTAPCSIVRRQDDLNPWGCFFTLAWFQHPSAQYISGSLTKKNHDSGSTTTQTLSWGSGVSL